MSLEIVFYPPFGELIKLILVKSFSIARHLFVADDWLCIGLGVAQVSATLFGRISLLVSSEVDSLVRPLFVL